jgi:pyridoxal phosphate enzyme (YggS family)
MPTLTTSPLRDFLAGRVASVEDRIRSACARAGRPRKSVTLVAVTKYVGPTLATLITELGVFDLGESRPQELWKKHKCLPPAVRWHLVGHLQRNKIERTLPLVTLIHSVDSHRLLEALDQEAEQQGRTLDVLLEVNASREANKSGFIPEVVPGLARELVKLRRLRVRGLMTMAAMTADPEDSRAAFAEVRQLRDRLQRDLGDTHRLDQLSMGMTNDFDVAIEEGATLIRIGSALFEGVPDEGID